MRGELEGATKQTPDDDDNKSEDALVSLLTHDGDQMTMTPRLSNSWGQQ